MAFTVQRRIQQPRLLPIAVAVVVATALTFSAARSVASAFVASPAAAPRVSVPPTVAIAGASAGILAAPLAALAELPPLEDLPIEEIAATRQTGPQNPEIFGLSVNIPAVLFAIFCAVCWAGFWVTNLQTKKEQEGEVVNYIGGGMLPPEGYTNPLDPRVSEEYAEESDPLYEKKGPKSASSAIV
mmetsp:Transcript_74398/g.187446  ORF Transcript_74398/g.187446 Transcript_74398/m.187446 type:complete len:185 (-) Transcript_74398:319-873(-)